MPSSDPKAEWGGFLPSHLLPSQAARALGVTPAAVRQRMVCGTLPTAVCLGKSMVPTSALLGLPASLPVQLPIAYTVDRILEVVREAGDALALGQGDRAIFTAEDLLGVYFGLSAPPAGGKP